MGAAGEVRAARPGALAFVGTRFEKDRALERVVAAELLAEPVHLLRDECFHGVVVARLALGARELSILRRQRPQEGAGQVHVAMRQMQARVALIELERVAALAIRLEIDSQIKAALRIRLVTVIAIELLAVYRRDVVREVAGVIEFSVFGSDIFSRINWNSGCPPRAGSR